MLEIVSKSNNLSIYTCGDSRLRGRRSKNPESKDSGERHCTDLCNGCIHDSYNVFCYYCCVC